MKQTNNFDPCRACPMAGLCDSDECGMKLYNIDSNMAPKSKGSIKLPRYNDVPAAKVVSLKPYQITTAVQLKFDF